MSKPKLQVWHEQSDVPMINEPVLLKFGTEYFAYFVLIFPDVLSYTEMATGYSYFEWCYCSAIGERTPMEKAAPEMYEVLTRIKREMECDENWYMVINDVEDALKHARGEK